MVYREVKERGITRLTGSALLAWPINSVYISFASTNPAGLFGGTWTAIGTGRMLIGVDPTDATMDAAGDTGGSKTHTLSKGNIPPHEHGPGGLVTASNGNHAHPVDVSDGTGSRPGQMPRGTITNVGTADPSASAVKGEGAHTHNITGNTGDGAGDGLGTGAVNHMPPYLAVYMWRRTA